MMATSRNQFRYFALPAEIRNQIMEYVLRPGDVYIRSAKRTSHAQQPENPPSSRLKRILSAMATLCRQLSCQPQRLVPSDVHLKEQFTVQQPGFNLLATCRQAYNDGHYMFYTMNTFHWPPVPSNDPNDWYTNLRPEHRKLIKTICIDLDLVDLMYGCMDIVEDFARRRYGGRPDDYDGNAWSLEAMAQLEVRMWGQMFYMYWCARPQELSGFVGLEKVIVQSSIGRCVLSSQFRNDDNEWHSLTELITAVSHHFETIIQFHVNGRGWKETKKWLEGLSRTRFRA